MSLQFEHLFLNFLYFIEKGITQISHLYSTTRNRFGRCFRKSRLCTKGFEEKSRSQDLKCFRDKKSFCRQINLNEKLITAINLKEKIEEKKFAILFINKIDETPKND